MQSCSGYLAGMSPEGHELRLHLPPKDVKRGRTDGSYKSITFPTSKYTVTLMHPILYMNNTTFNYTISIIIHENLPNAAGIRLPLCASRSTSSSTSTSMIHLSTYEVHKHMSKKYVHVVCWLRYTIRCA